MRAWNMSWLHKKHIKVYFKIKRSFAFTLSFCLLSIMYQKIMKIEWIIIDHFFFYSKQLFFFVDFFVLLNWTYSNFLTRISLRSLIYLLELSKNSRTEVLHTFYIKITRPKRNKTCWNQSFVCNFQFLCASWRHIDNNEYYECTVNFQFKEVFRNSKILP